MRNPLPFLLVGLGLVTVSAEARAQYPNLAGAYVGLDLGYNAVGDDVAFSGPFGGAFAGYRLRVAAVIRDYGMHEREEAPEDSRALHG